VRVEEVDRSGNPGQLDPGEGQPLVRQAVEPGAAAPRERLPRLCDDGEFARDDKATRGELQSDLSAARVGTAGKRAAAAGGTGSRADGPGVMLGLAGGEHTRPGRTAEHLLEHDDVGRLARATERRQPFADRPQRLWPAVARRFGSPSTL
jgi:hypothetical protein